MSLTTKPRRTRLDNGLVIVTEAMPSVASVSLGVFVGAGARVESQDEHGIAHLLEHMAFKGTRRRSARHIVEEIEAVGGDINAATSMEQTAYYARILSPDVPVALDILADILTDSALEPEEIAREQGVIRQEIAAVQDTPDDVVFELLQSAVFADQPLGRSILGTDASVSGFTRSQIKGFLTRHYLASEMVVAAAGALDHDEIVARVADLMGGLPGGAATRPEPARFVGGERHQERDLEQVNVALAFPGLAMRDRNIYAARVFATLFGGGMSSRLFQEVREKRGLCYTVSAFHWGYADIGLLGMHAATGPDDVAELVPVMLAELARAADDTSEEEVMRAKAQLRAGLLMSLESSAARADRLARQILMFGETRTVDEIVGSLEAVSVADVHDFARQALSAGRCAMATVGPSGRLASLDTIAKIGV